MIVKREAGADFPRASNKNGRSILGAAGEAASACCTDQRMRECLPGGLMAWVMVMVRIAMAIDAAPWPV
jgi:hypothetical protein